MMYFLLLTAFTVSVDSFICGFSLAKTSNKKRQIIACVFLTVLLMCFFTNYSALLLKNVNPVYTSVIGAIILILVGIYNLFFTTNNQSEKIASKAFILAGFAVGLDGAMANLSLSLMGINSFYVPIIIAVMHAIMVLLGIILSNVKLWAKIMRYNFISPVILIALGAYKLLEIFI